MSTKLLQNQISMIAKWLSNSAKCRKKTIVCKLSFAPILLELFPNLDICKLEQLVTKMLILVTIMLNSIISRRKEDGRRYLHCRESCGGLSFIIHIHCQRDVAVQELQEELHIMNLVAPLEYQLLKVGRDFKNSMGILLFWSVSLVHGGCFRWEILC